MASARTLTTNELGTIRHAAAAASHLWPIEVRLLPQPSDTRATAYTLHTPANAPVPFVPTMRDELRATLAVPEGALVYEVLRDGVLISTGGLEVRPPDVQALTSVHRLRLDSRPPSGAVQLPDGRPRHWTIRFHYNEMTWMARDVSVLLQHGCGIIPDTRLPLRRTAESFVADLSVSDPGLLTYRFCVHAHEALHANLSAPTRLGWDDGAMTQVWQLITWPLTLPVADLTDPAATPGDGLMRSQHHHHVPDVDMDLDLDVVVDMNMAPVKPHDVASKLSASQDDTLFPDPDDDDEDDDDDDHDDHDHNPDLVDHFQHDSALPHDHPQSAGRTVTAPTVNEWTPDLISRGSKDPTYDQPHHPAKPAKRGGLVGVGAVMFFLGSTLTMVLGRRGAFGSVDRDDMSVTSAKSVKSSDRRKSKSIESSDDFGTTSRGFFRVSRGAE